MPKKIINICLLASIGFLFSFKGSDFKAGQLKYARVQAAYQSNWGTLQALLRSKQVDPANFDLYLRTFKYEKAVELWVKNSHAKTYTLLKTIPVCAGSGALGPKRRQGDRQVPEGFYKIDFLQPYSDYHLALKVSYPNSSDRIKATAKDPGGDIMIHGNCVTIGCIPLQDAPIEEVYVLCVETMNRNRTVKADIYPCYFTSANNTMLARNFPQHAAFWSSLKKAYDHFELNHSLPKISTDKNGDYQVAAN